MKKIFIGAAAAAIALFSACSRIELPQETLPTGTSGGVVEQTYFTATLVPDTKVHLQYQDGVYKTYWDEGDCIYVCNDDTGEVETCMLAEGAGTSTGKFAGSIQARNYTAFYSYDSQPWKNDDDSYGMTLQNNRYGFFDYMMASSTTKTFSFKNICSYLKLNVSGNGEILYNIEIRSNDDSAPLCGVAKILESNGEPGLYFDSDDNQYFDNTSLYVSVYKYLGSSPYECIVAIPAQTYHGGLTVTLNTESRTEEFYVEGDIEMRRSHIRNLNLDLSGGGAPQENWVIEMTRDGGNSWSVTQNLEYRDGFFFFDDLYVSEGEQISFRFCETSTGCCYGCSTDFRDGRYKTNARVGLVPYGNMLSLRHQGYYDIYLNPEEDCFFIMSDYLQPSDLPTMEPALHETYESLETTYENQIAKVRGYVIAKNAFGYILAIDAKYDNYILLYDPHHKVDIDLGYSVDIYAAVKTYNDLKELDVTEVCWFSIISSNYNDAELRSPFKVEYLSTYNSYKYDYLSVTGRLESSINPQNGRTEYTLIVQSPEYFEVIISQPYQELAEFVGKPVVVEGFHMGHNASGATPTLKIMLKRIWHEDSMADSSTEDVLPGESIIVTNN